MITLMLYMVIGILVSQVGRIGLSLNEDDSDKVRQSIGTLILTIMMWPIVLIIIIAIRFYWRLKERD